MVIELEGVGLKAPYPVIIRNGEVTRHGTGLNEGLS